MDQETKRILEIINSHSKIKKYLTAFCYVLIFGGFISHALYFINRDDKSVKMVSKYSQNPDKFRVEKIMTNPHITFQHDDNKTYQINAKSASHVNNEEILMYDVLASGEIGKITAGELRINEKGDRLTFTKNPVLILYQTDGE